MSNNQNRRSAIKNIIAGTATLSAGAMLTGFASDPQQQQQQETKLKGNINHAVCRWCYGSISLDDLCKASKDMGIKGIDLVGPKEWPTLKKYGLTSSMCNGAEIGLNQGWNRPQYHQQLIKNYTEMIPLVAKAGYTNLICFSGTREGMDDETGLKNCVDGLKQMMSLAEKHKVVLVMELLNSKVDHHDYMCDKSAWGFELAKRLGSENFKLLFDIYHMQIDEGDIIRTIKKDHQYIAHYHTGGVPGRNEIDDTQELYYPAIMKAIVGTGYKGFVAQEFIPAREDKLASLRQGIQICDV